LALAGGVQDQVAEGRQGGDEVRLAARVGAVDADDAEQVAVGCVGDVAFVDGFVALGDPRLGLEAEGHAVAEGAEVGDAELDEHGGLVPL
jgi:hypothetical protein